MADQIGALLEVTDFSGGMTDSYIDGPPNKGQLYDNFLIQKDNKLKTRYGLTFWDSAANAQPVNARINALIKHRTNIALFAMSGKSLYYDNSGWGEIKGPKTLNAALNAGSASSFSSWVDFRGHTILTNNAYSQPNKIYRDDSGNFQVRTAGLPSIKLVCACILANQIKSVYNLHRASLTEHVSADTTNAVTAADAHDLGSLITLVSDLLVQYPAHDNDAEMGSAWLYHTGQNSTDHGPDSTIAPKTLSDCVTILEDLKTKYDAHDNDASSHNSAGAHQVGAFYTEPQFSTGGTATYLYRLFYKYSYYVDGVLWEDLGPTTEYVAANAPAANVDITKIPMIANGSINNYDTNDNGTGATHQLTVETYRTIDNGSQFFFDNRVSNDQDVNYKSIANDTITDTALVLNEPLYTTGGVLDNDQPPQCKYVTAVNDIAVYANLKIANQQYPNSFITSIPGDFDSVPGSFQDEIETEITGVSNFGIYPILFSRNRIYRLEGIIDNQGRGTIFKREVSRTKGTISNNSIVQIPSGLVFAADDGFYFCDGFNPPQILSIHLIQTYKTLLTNSSSELKIYGEYDSLENRVYWTCQRTSSNSDNDSIFILDLNYGLKPDSVFTTSSGQGATFKPTALAFFNRVMVQSDVHGYILKYDLSTTTDLNVDTSKSASAWNTIAVIPDYKSCALSFGSQNMRKWVPMMTLEGKKIGNSSIQVNSNNDDSGNFVSLKEIRTRDQFVWGDPSTVWGVSTCIWNEAAAIKVKRRFPAGGIRCFLKQIEITSAYAIQYISDVYGTGAVNASAKSVTITNDWPTDIAGYYISFASDSYTNQYLITSRDSNSQITFSDATGKISVNLTNEKWEVWGYGKNDVYYITSYSVRNDMISQTQDAWTGVTGANA